MPQLHDLIQQITGRAPTTITRLSGGCIGDVFRVRFPDGSSWVAKTADGTGATLELEGFMLRYLKDVSRLPVPEVYHSSETLLLMEFVEGDSNLTPEAEAHAADLLVELHSIRADKYGFEYDTLIGGLHQPNTPSRSWLEFFRDHRLLYMAHEAYRARRLPADMLARVERFASQIEHRLIEPPHPSLIHGDMWTTNILAKDGRITAFLDPAIYYAHPEIELAFSTLFNTFGAVFFRRYQEHRPIPEGFFEQRRDIYNLYPLLVHVRLFGSGYVGAVDRILRRFGG